MVRPQTPMRKSHQLKQSQISQPIAAPRVGISPDFFDEFIDDPANARWQGGSPRPQFVQVGGHGHAVVLGQRYLYLPEQQVGLFNDRFARPLKPIKNTIIRAGRHRDGSHPHLRAFRSCRFVLGIVERFLAGGNKWQQPDEILKVRIAEGLLLQHQTPYLPAQDRHRMTGLCYARQLIKLVAPIAIRLNRSPAPSRRK